MTDVLRVNGVSIAHGRGPSADLSVREVSLTVDPGEMVGIVGVSGAGKSVLARAMTGYVASPGHVVEGNVEAFGVDVTNASDRELRRLRGKKIGIIVQNARSHLNPVLTIGRQIGNVYRSHNKGVGRKAAASKVIEMLSDVGIPAPSERFHAYPHEMSGGMAQRCMIAMAMICSPPLLIADEPTSGLDVTIQDQILKLFRRSAQEQGAAGILISRDMGIIANFCNRVFVMDNGRIVESDSAERFFSQASHPLSRSLIAAATYRTGTEDDGDSQPVDQGAEV